MRIGHTEYMREWRKRNKDKHLLAQQKWKLKNPHHNKELNRTFDGYFLNVWKRMNRRCKGQYKAIYTGLPCMSKDQYAEFLDSTQERRRLLFDQWIESGTPRHLAPSIDRIEPSKGYVIGNCQWLTVSENSKRSPGPRGKKWKQKRIGLG